MPNPWEMDWQTSRAPGAMGNRTVVVGPADPNRQATARGTNIRNAKDAVDLRFADDKARADLENTRLSNEERRLKIEKDRKDASGEQSGRVPMTAATRDAAIAGYKSSQQLEAIIANLEKQYKTGPGATTGVAGLQDYLPTTSNQRFNNAGNAARGIVGAALGFTGGQLNTEKEADASIGPYLPQADDRDEVILDKIATLKQLQATARDRAIAQLGGVPDENGVIKPVTKATTPAQSDKAAVPAIAAAVEGKGPTAPAGMPTLSPSEINEVQSLAKYGGPEATMKWFAEHHAPITAENAKAVADYYAKGGTGNPSVQYNAAGYNAKLDAMNAQKDALAPIGKGALAANGMTAGASPVLAGGIQGVKSAIAGDGFTPGYELGRDAEARRFDKARDAAGVPGMVAEGGGMALGALLTGGAVARLPGALGARIAASPASSALLGDTMFGGATGGFLADPGDTASGAVKGAAVGLGGNLTGRALARPIAAGVRKFSSSAPGALSPAESTIANMTANNQNIPLFLSEAQGLGLPATLADATPELRALAGSAVRRSPTAAGVAENTLQSRARGQIDRLGNAVERDFGPTANVPATADALTAEARARAGPLYDAAYANPARTSPVIEDMLNRPAGRQAMSRAQTIAANEGRDPRSMGFDLDAEGNTVFTQTPSPQTLDYVKRGLDDVVESHRDPVTGRLNLDEAGRAVQGVQRGFRTEATRLNPDYGEALAAYAGPASQRSALQQGQKAINTPSDVMRQAIEGLNPAETQQYALGHRSGIMDQAERVRLSTNPWEGAFGSPEAQARLGVSHPNGNATRFGRQYDLERNMARTNNEVMGGSQTAGRVIADQQFEGGMIPGMVADAAGGMAFGAPPVATALNIAKRLPGDLLKMGVGKKAVEKADALAPMLLNSSPQETSAMLADLLSRQTASNNYIAGLRRQIAGPAGAVLTGQALSPIPGALALPFALQGRQ